MTRARQLIASVILAAAFAAHAQLGAVRVSVDTSCNWTTKRADGTTLSTAASLQPGINEAQSSGYPLVVDGRSSCLIPVPATFGPASKQSYTLRNVVLQHAGEGPAVTLDTLSASDLQWSGGINYSGPFVAVFIYPSNAVPGDAYPISQLSSVRLPFIYTFGGTPYAAVLFNPSVGAIVNNSYSFAGIYGGNNATNGIVMTNPPDIYKGMGQNYIDFNLVAGVKSTGIQEGNGNIDPSKQPLGTNVWRGAITSDYAMYSAYQTFGILSQAYLSSISVNSGSFQFGVMMYGSAAGNYIVTPQISGAAQPCFGNGVNNNKCVTPPY